MGRAIGLIAYTWLITSEFCEELFHLAIGDSVRHFFFASELKEKAPRIYPETLPDTNATAKAGAVETV